MALRCDRRIARRSCALDAERLPAADRAGEQPIGQRLRLFARHGAQKVEVATLVCLQHVVDVHADRSPVAQRQRGDGIALGGLPLLYLPELHEDAVRAARRQEGRLQIDLQASEADSPDRLKIGTTTLQLIRRSGRLAVRLRDSQNPLRLSFRGEQWYPIQNEYRVEATWVPLPVQRLVQIENVRGGSYTQINLDPKLVGSEIGRAHV